MAEASAGEVLRFTAELPEAFEDFDILRVPGKLWPHIYVMAVEPGPRFCLTHTGTHIDESVQRNCTGMHMDEIIHGPKSEEVLGFFRQAIETGKTLKVEHIVALPGRPQLRILATARPYYDQLRQPNHIVGAIHFQIMGELPEDALELVTLHIEELSATQFES